MTKIYAYGFLGWEMEINHHIKTRILFAITDQNQTKLAWYTFAQDMMLARWQGDFDYASVGGKLDRNEVFADVLVNSPLPYEIPFTFDVSDLAPLLGRGVPAFATLDMFDYNPLGVTSCTIRVQVKCRPIYFGFDMKILQKRQTFDIRKTGRLYFLGTERFSIKSIENGPPNTQLNPLSPNL